MTNLERAIRTQQACTDYHKICKQERKVRAQSVKREKDKLEAIAEKYDLSPRYIKSVATGEKSA